MEFKSKYFDDLSNAELYRILKARAEIFVVEQECVYQDLDDKDYHSLHVFLEEAGDVVAYLRAYEEEPGMVRMGRVLSLQHGKGYGRMIMDLGMKEINNKLHPKEIIIHAQCYAAGFYELAGFHINSKEFLEDGIPHVEMMCKF